MSDIFVIYLIYLDVIIYHIYIYCISYSLMLDVCVYIIIYLSLNDILHIYYIYVFRGT